MLKELLSLYSWDDCVQYFIKRGFTHVNPNNDREHYLFLDRGAKVLAVAHLDHVMFTKPKKKKTYIHCPQLDDRLGLWVIYALLPTLNCRDFDILLTDHEEMGASTAEYFTPGKEYNWVFEFDRMGAGDCALYQYDTPGNKELVKKYGFNPVGGSFTDICDLNHLGCAAFNFAVGYHNQHSQHCYADLDDTVACAKRFIKLFDEHGDIHIPHDGRKQSRWDMGDYNNYGTYNSTYSGGYQHDSYHSDDATTVDGYGPASQYRKESDFLEGYEYDPDTDLFVPKEDELLVCTNSGMCVLCDNHTDILGDHDMCGACAVNYVEILEGTNPEEFCLSCQKTKYDSVQGLCEYCRAYYTKSDDLDVIMVYEKLAATYF
jgi:hypothetical protein